MDRSLQESFLDLIRLGIGHQVLNPSSAFDWKTIKAFAAKQGLDAIFIDGIERLPEGHRPPKERLLEWIGEVLQGYEYRFELYRRTIAEMASFYNNHGYKMMVLKGYACSLDWPKPEHRPSGDIDIWLFGKQKEADAVLTKEIGIAIDKSHHHHTVFNWGDFTVENHYDFVNVHAHRSSAELEKTFKELGKDDSQYVEVKQASTGSVMKVYLPSPNLHALFLIKHLASHFSGANITLRQVLDLAFFIEKNIKSINLEWLNEMLERYHLKEFSSIINAVCVEDLGFSPNIFSNIQFNPQLKEKVLGDILNPKYGSEEPEYLFPRLIYKYRRWQANEWKQKICFCESRRKYFWGGVWAKLIKPTSL